MGVSPPGARVTWSTTVPPECVASIRVEFRSWRHGSVVRSYTTLNTSQTEVTLTGPQCGTTYYIRVVVAGVSIVHGNLYSNQAQVLVGGKVTSCEVRLYYDHEQSRGSLSCLKLGAGWWCVWSIVKLTKTLLMPSGEC